jgi:hypothetical protein
MFGIILVYGYAGQVTTEPVSTPVRQKEEEGGKHEKHGGLENSDSTGRYGEIWTIGFLKLQLSKRREKWLTMALI